MTDTPNTRAASHSGSGGPRKQAAAMGRRVGGGLSWLMIATLVVKAFSLVNIAILGVLLGQEDFGIFATAIGVAAIINVMRDGGARRILIQKGLHRFAGLIGPTYTWTVLLNLLAAAILCALGPVLATIHNNDQYVMVMVTLGIAAGIYGPGMIYRTRLSMEFRYKAVAGMDASSSIVRYIAMIALALGGAGPLTFTWSLVIMAAYEWLYGLAATRDPLVRVRPRFRLWPAIWARAKWLLMGAIALALLRQGDYLVLGFVLDPRVIGVYAFAYMIGDQIMSVLASNLQQVLMPTMATFQHDRKRHVAAILRVCDALTLVAAGFGGLIAVTFEPLEQMVWQGKWAGAVPAAQALALCFALRLLVTIQESALSSTGRFRTQLQALLKQGVGMALVALISRLLFPTRRGLIALGIGLWFVLGITGITAWSLKRAGVPITEFLMAVLRPWGALTILAMAGILADLWIQNGTVSAALREGIAPDNGRLHHATRLVIIGVTYSGLSLLLVRFTLTGSLREMLAVAPPRLGRPAALLLGLREQPAR